MAAVSLWLRRKSSKADETEVIVGSLDISVKTLKGRSPRNSYPIIFHIFVDIDIASIEFLSTMISSPLSLTSTVLLSFAPAKLTADRISRENIWRR